MQKKVDKKTHAAWLSKRRHGDNTKIAVSIGISSAAISVAINSGIGSINIINAINNFYDGK